MLGKIAGLLSFLGIGLYFTGWIYRWAYFGYFQLEVTSLDLPFESFLIVPIQVFFGNLATGDLSTLFRTIWIAIASFILLPIIVPILFHLIKFSTQELDKIIKKLGWKLLGWIGKIKRPKITRNIQSFFYFAEINYQHYDQALIKEIVVIFWLLMTLFFLGKTQGNIDAIQDAYNETSSLPVVTLITPENQLPLGRKIRDLTDNPNISNFRIIGDIELYKELLERDYNDKTQPKSLQIIWRLLFDTDGQYYIFPSLPKNAPSNVSPPVVVIQQSDRGEYTIILSPEAPNP
ncbi:MAG: hypothetical protein F6K40_31650 [Okeania sp. SIO3I5]|uniref:hypothetical protein n=1 Tax=Okeania sp. SIO3I5 TaxID=2607805 RepID=UPI0013BCA82E|nr:hypothetical protein [Okeania sp. SIO3I5]NEQ40540.1 hypothetical protein [Okeania sp. SIO3I5]